MIEILYRVRLALKGQSMKNHHGSCDLLHTYTYRRKMRKKDGPETFSSGKLRFENFQGLTLVRNQAVA